MKAAAVTISRTGFTGDLGYELFVAADAGAFAVGPAVRGRARRTASGPSATRRSTARGIEAGLIVANADFVDRRTCPPRRPRAHARRDRPGLHGRSRQGPFQRPPRHRRGARRARTLRHVLVGLEIEGNIPAEHAIVYHRKTQGGRASSAPAIWSPTGQAQHRDRQPGAALWRHGHRRSLGRDLRACANCNTRR